MKEHKKCINESGVWKLQERYKDLPHGWVQWKGTDVCMDIYCKCGYHSHIDDSFTYYIKCPKCKTVYFCNGHIEFIEIEQEPMNCVKEGDL
jgi:phage FluMu protein Com